MSNPEKLPIFFIPHGGGPWHVMADAFGDPVGYGLLRDYLIKLGQEYSQVVKAILVISGHWEETAPTVHFGDNPTMYYDYYGFPESTYQLKWPAPGNPELAGKIENLFKNKGFAPKREYKRGFDHGTFVPFMVAFPDAKIPVVQLSLVNTLEPSTHIAIGKAIEPLRSEGVLIVGSGMSYHNMRGFMSGSPMAAQVSKQFDDWLTRAVENEENEKRNEMLTNWLKAPRALEAHPRSEHLVPLFVASGAAGTDRGHQDYAGKLLSVSVSGYKFG